MAIPILQVTHLAVNVQRCLTNSCFLILVLSPRRQRHHRHRHLHPQLQHQAVSDTWPQMIPLPHLIHYHPPVASPLLPAFPINRPTSWTEDEGAASGDGIFCRLPKSNKINSIPNLSWTGRYPSLRDTRVKVRRGVLKYSGARGMDQTMKLRLLPWVGAEPGSSQVQRWLGGWFTTCSGNSDLGVFASNTTRSRNKELASHLFSISTAWVLCQGFPQNGDEFGVWHMIHLNSWCEGIWPTYWGH